ncbi:MAG: hypothetical protein EXR54_06900 [Dehalococcoidia bacterium]|nr:hypothetical protein [Dehalococcoidia bacterium]MSQ17279.1 hypothetical protein [Dehalococcoidia bacterium]
MASDRLLVEALQKWTRSKESANRHNRDLLQYGAVVAGSAGMVAGAGGLTALAGSGGRGLPWWAALQLSVLAVAAVVAIAGGVMLLLRTYRLRELAEAEAERSMDRLIELRPDQFLPGPVARRPG